MNLKVKSFLDDLAALLKSYNIRAVVPGEKEIIFFGESSKFSIFKFQTVNGKLIYKDVLADYEAESECCVEDIQSEV